MIFSLTDMPTYRVYVPSLNELVDVSGLNFEDESVYYRLHNQLFMIEMMKVDLLIGTGFSDLNGQELFKYDVVEVEGADTGLGYIDYDQETAMWTLCHWLEGVLMQDSLDSFIETHTGLPMLGLPKKGNLYDLYTKYKKEAPETMIASPDIILLEYAEKISGKKEKSKIEQILKEVSKDAKEKK